MTNDASPNSQESSLFFLSTQIQACHEDREQIDTKLSQLQKFKNGAGSPKMAPPKAVKVTKPKRKSSKKTTKGKSKPRPITSVSAFVLETLRGKKTPDSQGLLDRFLGDPKKLDDFLAEVEVATSTPHLLSRKPRDQHSGLVSGPEWKSFSETLRLKFPNLSKKNKKTLKVISSRLEDLKRTEIEYPATQDSASVWSQASRQPSNELSREDLIWLYDLDEDQLKSDTSVFQADDTPNSPPVLTLSQAMGDPTHLHNFQDDCVSSNEDNSGESQSDDDKSDEDKSDEDKSGEDESGEYVKHSSRDSGRNCSPESITHNRSQLDATGFFSNTHSLSLTNSQNRVADIIPNSEDEVEPFSEQEFIEWLNQSHSSPSSSNPFLSDTSQFKRPLSIPTNANTQSTESKTETLESAQYFAQKSTSRQPWNPGLFSATRSLVFASPSKDRPPLKEIPQSPSASGSLASPIKGLSSRKEADHRTIVSSPTQEQSRKHTPLNTPSCLRVDSSPVSRIQRVDSSPLTGKQYIDSSPLSEPGCNVNYKTPTSDDGAMDEDVFLSANASFPKESQASFFEQSDGESLHLTPLTLKRKLTYSARLKVTGHVELDPRKSTRVQLKVVHQGEPFSEEIIPNSEDEGEEGFSIIEITKNDEPGLNEDKDDTHNATSNANTSVLQVPSSPEVDQLQRPWEYRI